MMYYSIGVYLCRFNSHLRVGGVQKAPALPQQLQVSILTSAWEVSHDSHHIRHLRLVSILTSAWEVS